VSTTSITRSGALVFALIEIAVWSRNMRAAIFDELSQDYAHPVRQWPAAQDHCA
jgi:hypothetical protein